MYKKLFIIFAIILAGCALVAGISRLRQPRSGTAAASTTAEANGRQLTAEGQIRRAEAIISRSPDHPEGYNMLAAAYMQRARETGDFSLNARAEAALKRSLTLAPEDFDGLKIQATLLLTFHRFREALEVAQRAQTLRPDNADVYGAMTDALVELGDYEAAVRAAQKMVDLRPDTAAYARVSYLRALYGDTEGAIEAMRVAVRAADPRSPETVAWCRVQLGSELLGAGLGAEAEREFDEALAIFPDYYMALSAKARARLFAGDMEGALLLYRRAQARVPLPDTAIALGDLLTKLGRTDEAQKEYELAEFIEQTGSGAGTYSRQLALLWADRNIRLDEALFIARRERAQRSDIYTSDALAWCLFRKGMYREAQQAMDEALRLGTRDARIFYHAGMIAEALGERRRAAKYLRLALELDQTFNILQADSARRALKQLDA